MGGAGESIIAVIAGELSCSAAFDCDLDFDKYGGIVLWILIMLYMFKALGVICDEYFVPSLEVIVEKLQLSNDVAGATFMAAGSSAPELFTNLVATFFIVNEGGVGTIVGSAIFNILVIVGATCYFACKDKKLKIWWYPLCRDCFFYVVSIIELVVFLADEHVKAWEGIVMICTYVLYCIYMKFNPRIVEALGLVAPLAVDTVESLTDIKVIEANRLESASIASVPSVECVSSKSESTQAVPSVEFIGNEKDRPSHLTPPGASVGSVSLRSGSHAVAEDVARQPECPGPGAVDVDAEKETSALASPKFESEGNSKVERDKHSEKNGCKAAPVRISVESSQAMVTVASNVSHLAPNTSPREQRRPSWSFNEAQKAEVERVRRTSKQLQEGVTANEGDAAIVLPSQDQSDDGDSRSCCRDPMVIFWEFTMPPPERWGGGLLFSAAIFYIFMLTYVMVDSTNRIGTILHIPPLAMALVFLAAGTSIPDALGSIAVAKQGEGDMAVCNALGSNVFDILIGLGVPWTIKTGIMGDEVTFDGKFDELIWDVVVLVGVLFLFVGALIFQNWELSRPVGYMLLSFYGLFLVYNVLMVWAFKVKEIDGE